MNSENFLDKSVMIKIDQNLRQSEIKMLKFLSKDLIPESSLEKMKYAYELFDFLVDSTASSSSDGRLIISQFLYLIGRNDLISNLDVDYKGLSEVVERSPFLDRFRFTLFELSRNLLKDDINCLKFLLLDENVSKSRLVEITDGEDLLSLLESIYPNKQELLEKLEQYFKQTSRHDVVRVLERCKKRPMDPHVVKPSVASGEEVLPKKENIPSYPMTRSPRGICLIINNECFGSLLGRRRGTDSDADAIQELFTSLDFKVENHKNLKSGEMEKILDELGKLDHSKYDCFFSFVLSHGESGYVLGSDENKLALRSVLSPFRKKYCPSLENKPKVFCIQACQGTDVVNDDLSTDDAKSTKIIEEADFLLALSTLPGYVSVRSSRLGTWYIQTLVKVVKKYYKELDFIRMLTIITKEVNEKNGRTSSGVLRQVPVPMTTLTRDLYLTAK